MKIAQLACTFPPYRGGIGNSVYNISAALADLGHEVTVFTPDYGQKNLEENLTGLADKFTVKRLRPLFKYGNAALCPQFIWQLKKFDIVHLHYPFYGALKFVLLQKILYGEKFKLVIHYHMDTRAGGVKGVIFYLYKILFLPLLARLADMVTCASLDYLKSSDLRNYYSLKPGKFRQILFGVNLEQFVTYHDHLSGERPHDAVLFVGALDKAHYFKGLENLIKAIASLKKDHPSRQILLNVVGNGELAGYYKKCAEDSGLGKSVIFYENIDNSKLVDFYNYCDCLALPSINRSEAFGLVLLEAMACSKPVITSNLPGVRSVFKNGREGLLVKPDNIKDLAEKLKIILADKNKAKGMGAAGRLLVEKKYTWAKVGKRLDLIYHYLLYAPKL